MPRNVRLEHQVRNDIVERRRTIERLETEVQALEVELAAPKVWLVVTPIADNGSDRSWAMGPEAKLYTLGYAHQEKPLEIATNGRISFRLVVETTRDRYELLLARWVVAEQAWGPYAPLEIRQEQAKIFTVRDPDLEGSYAISSFLNASAAKIELVVLERKANAERRRFLDDEERRHWLFRRDGGCFGQ